MPGVIQPQRSQGSLQTMLSLGQTAMAAKSAFGGDSKDPTQQATTAGQTPSTDAMATGQAVTSSASQMGDYPTSGNVYQRRLQRSY